MATKKKPQPGVKEFNDFKGSRFSYGPSIADARQKVGKYIGAKDPWGSMHQLDDMLARALMEVTVGNEQKAGEAFGETMGAYDQAHFYRTGRAYLGNAAQGKDYGTIVQTGGAYAQKQLRINQLEAELAALRP